MNLKNDLLKGLLVGIISDIVVKSLIYFFPSLPSIPKIVQPFWWVFLPIIFTLIFVVLGHIQGNKGGTTLIAAGTRPSPNYVQDELGLEKFGVLWRGLLGSLYRMGDLYVHVEGPYCPNCETKLSRDKKRNFFG